MKIDFDLEKSNKNNRDRELPFDRAADFDWETALYAEDVRHSYPERIRCNGVFRGAITRVVFYSY